MASKKKAAKKAAKPKGQTDETHAMEVGTFRMSSETRRHLKHYAVRVKLTQGELLRRFVSRLPKTRDKLVPEITVPVLPV